MKRFLAEWLIAALVVFAVAFEILLHHIEHWIKTKHPQLQPILKNLYRELMILGVVSFGFILYVFTGDRSADDKMTFEVAHVWTFLFAIQYTFIVCFAVGISLSLTKRWKRLERMHLVEYLENKECYRVLTEKRSKYKSPLWKHFGWWVLSPKKFFEYRKLHEIMTFHDMRWSFIHYRGLKKDFKFSKYLRKVKVAIFIELVEINPMNWLLLLGIIIVDQVRRYIGLLHRHFEPAYLIADSVFNMFVVTLLARKIRRIYWKLTKNPATYYDNVDVKKFRVELANAQERARNGGQSSDVSDSTSPQTSRTRFAAPADSSEVSSGVANYMFRNAPKEQDASKELLETAMKKHERSGTEQPMLIGMATAMPTRELDRRTPTPSPTPPDRPREIEHSTTDRRLPTPPPALHREQESGLNRHDTEDTDKQTRFNSSRKQFKSSMAAMLRTRQDEANNRKYKSTDIRHNYPRWVLRLFPRLGRIPTPAEKLFWFGSHRFFVFLVEFVLFFTNVNLSATISKLGFLIKARAQAAEHAKPAASICDKVVRAVVAPGAAEKIPKEPLESLTMLLVALGMGILALAYVLLRIANIMKKYIFVLNNADLVPDHLMDETIQTVNLKDMIKVSTTRDENGEVLARYDSDSDEDVTEEEQPQDHSVLRRNMTSYIESQNSNQRF